MRESYRVASIRIQDFPKIVYDAWKWITEKPKKVMLNLGLTFSVLYHTVSWQPLRINKVSKLAPCEEERPQSYNISIFLLFN